MIDDLIHLIPPQLAFICAAQFPQIVKGSKDFSETQQLIVVRPVIGRWRPRLRFFINDGR